MNRISGIFPYVAPGTKRSRTNRFIPKVFFIRKVYQDEQTKIAYIEILHEHIAVPKSFIGMFVLAEWNLKYGRLKIRYQNETKATIIKERSFVLNQRTRKLGGSVLFVM